MKTAFLAFIRNFKKRKTIYSITLGGFGIAMAVFVLISAFVIEEKSYDKHLPKLKNMYRMRYGERSGGIPIRYHKQIKEQIPEIEQIGLYNKNGSEYTYNNEFGGLSYLGVSEECIELFDIEFIKGNRESLFDIHNSLALTESYAKENFDSLDPIGLELDFNGEMRMITAIVADPPKTFSINYDAVWNYETSKNPSFWCYGRNETQCFKIYESAIVLKNLSDVDIVEEKLAEILKDCPVYKNSPIKLQSYSEIYFDTTVNADGHIHANSQIIKLLSIIAFIILILAILNYINLATAANKERFKEVCIRKTSGAGVKIIFRQFILESLIACAVSLLIGVALILIIAPVFTDIFGKEFDFFSSLDNKAILITLPVIVFIVGVVTGLFPAITASFFNPIALVQNRNVLNRSNARGIFNSVQFMVAIVLIVSVILINKQIKYVKTKDFGFNKEYLMSFRLFRNFEHTVSICEKLKNHTQIINVTSSEGVPFHVFRRGNPVVKSDGKKETVEEVKFISANSEFLKTYKIPLLTGRDFRKTDKKTCIINETLYKQLAWTDIENKFVGADRVVGVVKDIHYESLNNQIGKLCIRHQEDYFKYNSITVRMLGSNIRSTLNYITSVIHEFDPHYYTHYEFVDDRINNLYQQEEKQAKTVKIFALLAVVLACLGLYGMVEFSCKNRIKEIGVRKVNGARIPEIIQLLNRDFLMWVIIGYAVATPISWIAISKWLQSFAYRAPISWWVFIVSGIITMAVAMLTISYQSIKTARKNPIEALKYE